MSPVTYDRLAYQLFGTHADTHKDSYAYLDGALKKANIYEPAEIYRSRSILTGIVVGMIAAVIACISAFFNYDLILEMESGSISVLGSLASKSLTVPPLLASIMGSIWFILAFVIIISFLAAFIITQAFFVYYPIFLIGKRERAINGMFLDAVTFMYAIGNGGSNLAESFRALSEHKAIYGELSVEASAVVKGIDILGYDLMTAMRKVAATTPSEQFKSFLDSMISIMESGGDVSHFLYIRIEQYRSLREQEQKTLLDLLGMMAEIYVTALVAGPIFLIIIMMTIGIIQPTNLAMLDYVVYLVIPIGSVMFIMMLFFIGLAWHSDKVLKEQNAIKSFGGVPVSMTGRDDDVIIIHEWRYKARELLESPIASLINNPLLILPFTFMAAILVALWVYLIGGLPIHSSLMPIDHAVIVGFLIAVIPFSVLWEIKKHSVMKIEYQIPEFLKRLASINDSGLTLDKSLRALLRSNLGVLNPEVWRIVKDLDWGASVKDALVRFEYRVNTFSIHRIVTLIVKASESSANIKNTLQLSAIDAETNNEMRAARQSNMLVYISIIYISFFVFLYIAFALTQLFLPIPGVSTGIPDSSYNVSTLLMPQSYAMNMTSVKLLLARAVLIQGFFSGLVAGILGESSLYSGLKHSIILMLIGYLTIMLLM